MKVFHLPLFAATLAGCIALALPVTASDILWAQPANALPVRDLARSPDGSKIACASDDGVIKILDTGSGALQQLVGTEGWQTTGVSFIDAQLLASADYSGVVRFHDLDADGTVVRSVSRHSGKVSGMTHSDSAGMVVTVGLDNAVVFYADDPDSTSAATRLVRDGDNINVLPLDVAASPDGSMVAIATRKGWVVVYDPTTKYIVSRAELGTANVNCVDWSDNEIILAGDDDGVLHRITASTGDVASTVNTGSSPITAVAGDPNGNWTAVGTAAGGLQLHPANNGAPRNLPSHTAGISALVFTSDGTRLVAGDLSGRVAVYKVSVSVLENDWIRAGGAIQQLSKVQAPVEAMIALRAPDSLVAISDLLTGTASITSVSDLWTNAFQPLAEGQLAATSGSADIGLFSFDGSVAGSAESWWTPEASNITALAASADKSQLAAGDAAGTILVVDAATGLTTQTFEAAHVHGVKALHFSSDGTRLFSLGRNPDGAVLVHNLSTGTLASTLEPSGSDFTNLAISQDGSLLALVSDDGSQSTVSLYDATTLEALNSVVSDSFVQAVSFGSDNATLWIGTTATLSGIDLESMEVMGEIVMPQSGPTAIAPDAANEALVLGFADGSIVAMADPTMGVDVTDWLPGAVAYNGGWYHAAGFGWFFPEHFPWVWHMEHGYWYVQPVAPNLLWVYDDDPQLGWLYVQTSVSPYFYSPSHGWLYYALKSGDTRWFYKPADDTWIGCAN